MKPSHVFFGDSFISGVRPRKKPARGGTRVQVGGRGWRA
jgi:hypothetical protein